MILLEQTFKLNHSAEEIYGVITNLDDYGWQPSIDEIKIINQEHFLEIEHNGKHQDFITFVTVLKMTKDKEYEINIVNNLMEGIITYSIEDNGLTIKYEMNVSKKHRWSFRIGKTGLKAMQKTYVSKLEKKLIENRKR